jgi:hypothetical protein
MKTAWEGKPKLLECVDGAALRQKHPGSITGGWKQEKVRPSGECFLLTSPSIEHSHSSGDGLFYWNEKGLKKNKPKAVYTKIFTPA